MPKATPGSRVSARLQTPGAEGVEEGAVLERKTAGKVALEAVTELDSKFEEWHLHAKQDAAQAKADSDAGQVALSREIAALTALVTNLAQPTEPVHGRARGNQEGDPSEGVSSTEPEPEPGRGTPERLTRTRCVLNLSDDSSIYSLQSLTKFN